MNTDAENNVESDHGTTVKYMIAWVAGIVLLILALWYIFVGRTCINTDVTCTVIPDHVMSSISENIAKFY